MANVFLGFDPSPLRHSKVKEDSDESPPRKTKYTKESASPKRDRMPTKREDRLDRVGSSRHRNITPDSPGRKKELMKKTLEGKKAGLQNSTDMKAEIEELRRRQAESLAQV